MPEEVRKVVDVLTGLGFKVILIGARALRLYGVLRETRDWDFTVDVPYTPEVRDRITSALRALGCAVQWRKWGFYVAKAPTLT
ncbi:MAG: hypothetical protein QXP31_02890 [Pyrobaculum sp.]|jgi:hypothetical protein